MKVISGTLKGRNIKGFDIEGTRPTMDRVKESLFAMIQDYIDGSIILDLFAGSGNLGIEAISNGAKYVYFNDINKIAVKVIKSNIESFNISDKATVTCMNYKSFLKESSEVFDIIFLDPPYKDKILNEIINYIIDKKMLREEGIIVCEVSDDYLHEFSSLEKIKQRRYGDKEIIIYKNTCK